MEHLKVQAFSWSSGNGLMEIRVQKEREAREGGYEIGRNVGLEMKF